MVEACSFYSSSAGFQKLTRGWIDLPIYVKSVFSKGAAADEGSLKRGDQIISVNGQSLEGCTHDEAVSILKNTRGAVTMTVLTS